MQGLRKAGIWWLALMIASIGFFHSGPVFAQRAAERLDLADAVLLPRDLERIGVPGFAVDRAFWIEADDALGNLEDLFDLDESDDLEDAFDAGFDFAYDVNLELAVEEGPALVEVTNTLSQFESDNAAGDAFAAIADVVENDNSELQGRWGDQSLVFSDTFSIVIAIQVDDVLSVIGIDSDYLENEDQRAYFVARMALMAERSVASIGAAQERSGPEFGVTVVRFETEEPDRVIAGDRYVVDGGQFVPLTTTQTFSTSFAGIQIDAFQIDASYERFLYPAGLEGAIVNMAITRHATVDLAATYVRHTQDRLDFGGGYANLREVANLDLPGDAAVAYSYSVTYDEELVTTGLAVAVQVGDQVIAIEVDSTDGVDDDEVLAIAEMQVSCLSGGDCEPVPYPGD